MLTPDYTIGFRKRIQLTYPRTWFGSTHDFLDAIDDGRAAGLSTSQQQILDTVPFTRIRTATGMFLDIAARDFYGDRLARFAGEEDGPFRGRILSGLFKAKGTRDGFVAQVYALTGAVPVVIDPRRPYDTGAMGGPDRVPTVFYSSVGRDSYTNYKMGYQWFVRLTVGNTNYSRETIMSQVARMMPLGTVCWLNLNITG